MLNSSSRTRRRIIQLQNQDIQFTRNNLDQLPFSLPTSNSLFVVPISLNHAANKIHNDVFFETCNNIDNNSPLQIHCNFFLRITIAKKITVLI